MRPPNSKSSSKTQSAGLCGIGGIVVSIAAFQKHKEVSEVAHACNPNYLGGRDWEDGGLRPAWAKS
jgi:hypothetical protein